MNAGTEFMRERKFHFIDRLAILGVLASCSLAVIQTAAASDDRGCREIYSKNIAELSSQRAQEAHQALSSVSGILISPIIAADLVSKKMLENRLLKADAILAEAQSGGGSDLDDLQDTLAKENPMFCSQYSLGCQSENMSRTQFRQLVLITDQAHQFCENLRGDTVADMVKLLAGLPDDRVRLLSSGVLRKEYVESAVQNDEGLTFQVQAAAGAR